MGSSADGLGWSRSPGLTNNEQHGPESHFGQTVLVM